MLLAVCVVTCRHRRRHRHANRAAEVSSRDCLSDSELLMYDDSVSR